MKQQKKLETPTWTPLLTSPCLGVTPNTTCSQLWPSFKDTFSEPEEETHTHSHTHSSNTHILTHTLSLIHSLTHTLLLLKNLPQPKYIPWREPNSQALGVGMMTQPTEPPARATLLFLS